MFVSNILMLMCGPLILLFTIFSLKKMGMDSLINMTNGKDRKLIPFVLLIIFVGVLYSCTLLQAKGGAGILEEWMLQVLFNNIYIAAVYTFCFLVLPSSFILWFIIKKIYIRKNMSSALTVMHVISVLSLNRLVNYNYLDFDDAIFFWVICYAMLMCYGMLEGGKTKKKIIMIAAVVIALLLLTLFGSIDVVGVVFLMAILLVENLVLFVIQNKFQIFRNIIRQGVLLVVTLGFVVWGCRM